MSRTVDGRLDRLNAHIWQLSHSQFTRYLEYVAKTFTTAAILYFGIIDRWSEITVNWHGSMVVVLITSVLFWVFPGPLVLVFDVRPEIRGRGWKAIGRALRLQLASIVPFMLVETMVVLGVTLVLIEEFRWWSPFVNTFLVLAVDVSLLVPLPRWARLFTHALRGFLVAAMVLALATTYWGVVSAEDALKLGAVTLASLYLFQMLARQARGLRREPLHSLRSLRAQFLRGNLTGVDLDRKYMELLHRHGSDPESSKLDQ